MDKSKEMMFLAEEIVDEVLSDLSSRDDVLFLENLDSYSRDVMYDELAKIVYALLVKARQ